MPRPTLRFKGEAERNNPDGHPPERKGNAGKANGDQRKGGASIYFVTGGLAESRSPIELPKIKGGAGLKKTSKGCWGKGGT